MNNATFYKYKHRKKILLGQFRNDVLKELETHLYRIGNIASTGMTRNDYYMAAAYINAFKTSRFYLFPIVKDPEFGKKIDDIAISTINLAELIDLPAQSKVLELTNYYKKKNDFVSVIQKYIIDQLAD